MTSPSENKSLQDNCILLILNSSKETRSNTQEKVVTVSYVKK